MAGPAWLPVGGLGGRIVFSIIACFMLNGCAARDKLLPSRPTAVPGKCYVSDCASKSGDWQVARMQKARVGTIETSRTPDLCESHARMIMDGYRFTENPEEVDEIHWVRFIIGNLVLGTLLGFALGVGMIRLVEKVFGHDSSLARAGNRAIILYILGGWGTAFFAGWNLRF